MRSVSNNVFAILFSVFLYIIKKIHVVGTHLNCKGSTFSEFILSLLQGGTHDAILK